MTARSWASASNSSARARPVLLRAVHRGVGVAEQRLGRLELAARERDADARGDEHLAVGERDRLRQTAVRHALGELLRGRPRRGRRAEHGELVAAEAGDRVARADRGAQPVGDGDEQPVAGGVAEAVVDHLEVVEVEEQHRDALVVELGVGERAPEPVDEEQPVRQPGERVVDRLVREPLAARLALGDVLDLAHEVERLAGDVADDRPGARTHTARPSAWRKRFSSRYARAVAGRSAAASPRDDVGAVLGVGEGERSTTPSELVLGAAEHLRERTVHAGSSGRRAR